MNHHPNNDDHHSPSPVEEENGNNEEEGVIRTYRMAQPDRVALMDVSASTDEGSCLSSHHDYDYDDEESTTHNTEAYAAVSATAEHFAVESVRQRIVWGLYCLAILGCILSFYSSVVSHLWHPTQQTAPESWLLEQWNAQIPQVMNDMANDLIASVSSQQEEDEFPTVTISNFVTRYTSTLHAEQWSTLVWCPLVTHTTRNSWELYVQHQYNTTTTKTHNHNTRMPDEINLPNVLPVVPQRHRHLSSHPHNTYHVRNDIFNVNGETATGDGPFLPYWQSSEQEEMMINLNLLSVPQWHMALTNVLTTTTTNQKNMGPPTAGPFSPPQDNEQEEEPWTGWVQPVFHPENTTTIVGVLLISIPWTTALLRVPEESSSSSSSSWTVVVVQSNCDDENASNATKHPTRDPKNSTHRSASFEISNGTTTFLKWNPTLPSRSETTTTLESTTCHYTVYWSLSKDDTTRQSMWWWWWSFVWHATMGVVMCVVAVGVFDHYNQLVYKRQQIVLDHAMHNNAIVSSLFPEQVRDRLFGRSETNDVAALTSGDAASSSDGNGGGGGGDDSSVMFEPTKQQLKSFLHQHNDNDPLLLDPNHNNNSRTNGNKANNSNNNRPIADLFPHCTVFFADIAGFTAWSSIRDPPQVFTLLESVYQSFDKIAKKRNVFKVETIGDCYVAVTGLPDPQEDHAVILCRFAYDCRAKLREVIGQLQLQLGPDTADLKLRIGLHSGPVTAGVLRGEKSRFQLFGDTVNTAARMESTGEKNKIQLSGTTVAALESSGKGHWVVARENKVYAKGKGEMQTYWLTNVAKLRRNGSSASRSSDDALSRNDDNGSNTIWGGADTDDEDGAGLDAMTQKTRHQSLIDYNVDVIASLLKQVVARRRVMNMSRVNSEDEPAVFERLDQTTRVIDEVTDSISLPAFDASAYKGYVDPSSIQLGPTVMAQLKRYVTIVAAMYRNNPFHNFEHASHVTMSVNKLLQRIVAPELKVRRRSLCNTPSLASDFHCFTYGITSDPLTQLAIVFGALIHDMDHWGIPNEQLIKEGVPIAERYQKRSVAEQNSVDLAWDLLMDQEEYGELCKCLFPTMPEFKRFRQVLVNVVMTTDIDDPAMVEMRDIRWKKAFEENDEDTPNRKATIVIEHIMQASDVAHSMQHWLVYLKWNRRLFDELYTAYRAGRMEKDPSSFWYQTELDFFDKYVIPLAKKLKDCGVFGVSSDECLNYAVNNRSEWEANGRQIIQELVDNYQLRDKEEADRLERAKQQAEEEKESGQEGTSEESAQGAGTRKRGKRFARRRSLFASSG